MVADLHTKRNAHWHRQPSGSHVAIGNSSELFLLRRRRRGKKTNEKLFDRRRRRRSLRTIGSRPLRTTCCNSNQRLTSKRNATLSQTEVVIKRQNVIIGLRNERVAGLKFPHLLAKLTCERFNRFVLTHRERC